MIALHRFPSGFVLISDEMLENQLNVPFLIRGVFGNIILERGSETGSHSACRSDILCDRYVGCILPVLQESLGEYYKEDYNRVKFSVLKDKSADCLT
jgi:hypothetical protein